MPTPAILVVLRGVDPYGVRAVDVAGAQDYCFARSHSRESLQLDHGSDLRRHKRECCLDNVVSDGRDRIGLSPLKFEMSFGGAVRKCNRQAKMVTFPIAGETVSRECCKSSPLRSVR